MGKPEYEKYPVSEEEMGKRYKNWTKSLAMQMAVLYKVGKEVGGEEFVEKLKEAYRDMGRKQAPMFMKVTGTETDDFKDVRGISKIANYIDDGFANFWDGYIENTPQAFEKELTTCPVAKAWSETPELCEVHLFEMFKAMGETLNSKYKFQGFSKLLPKGDNCCRYRIEMENE